MIDLRQHVAHFKRHGYAVIEGFLRADEVARSQAELEAIRPGWVGYTSGDCASGSSFPASARPRGWDEPPRSRRDQRFPFVGSQLNANTMHPWLKDFAAAIAGHDDLFLEQADLNWKCTEHYSDAEQKMHMDYQNHTLVYPSSDPRYAQTAYLLYYTDVDDDLAPFAVCPQAHYQEDVHWPSIRSRQHSPQLYEQEVRVTAPAGTLIAYSMRTFHRGTSFRKEGTRIAQFITYAPNHCPWLGIVGWSEQGTHPEFTAWVEAATVAERHLLGFPPPGHDYWTQETLKGVAARYPGMDMSPYRRE